MPRAMEAAFVSDAVELATLHTRTAAALTARFGKGPWSITISPEGMLRRIRDDRVMLLRLRRRIVATLRLAARKPWAIDRSFFVAGEKPLYLLDMAVAPEQQRAGLGRRCLEDAVSMARAVGADSIRLDAYDAPAGAGGFYRACGFTEVGRAVYRRIPLIYYERRIS
ncbi:MAG TPA: GNAT family N-acetyltransferase [Gemmatimonadales bacterium]|nr:GNAT family N-acetyltransferase [Gemmatimonadales bacterium]